MRKSLVYAKETCMKTPQSSFKHLLRNRDCYATYCSSSEWIHFRHNWDYEYVIGSILNKLLNEYP